MAAIKPWNTLASYYIDVIMSTMTSQITSLTVVYSTVYSDADQRKHQSSTSLAFERVIHREPVNSPHKWPVTQKMFPYDDVIMVGRFITRIKIWYVQSSACISCNTISQGIMKYVKLSMQGRRFMIYQHASFNVWNVRKRRFSYIWINSIFFYNWNFILTAIVVRCIPLGNADNKNDKNNNNDNDNSLFSKKLHRCYNTTIII